MKVQVNELQQVELTEVFNPISLVTTSGEELTICMRDTGFELFYNRQKYAAQDGQIFLLKTSKVNQV